MRLINSMQKPDLPGTLLFQPAAMLTLPNSVEVSDALSVNGGGVGGGSNSIRTALGEYFERRHFYREVISRRRGRLDGSLQRREVRGFAEAFVQTASNSVSVKELMSHTFALTEVVRSSDFTKCLIPTVCISLSSHGLGEDCSLYPLRDTCGCSFYWFKDVAFLGAVKECLERQFLVRFWLTKKCCSRVSSANVESLLKGMHVKYLYSALIASGEMTFLDISDSRFPGVCILAIYGTSRVNARVKYCAGMSYASGLALALEKSLLELWQTYRFMDLFKVTDSEEAKLEDPYIRHFLSCNSYQTCQEVVDVVECGGTGSTLGFELPVFLSVLKRMDVSGYFYSKCEMINGVECVFAKYISPDLFLHMNNSSNFNLENRYSKDFKKSIDSSRLCRMVPFP